MSTTYGVSLKGVRLKQPTFMYRFRVRGEVSHTVSGLVIDHAAKTLKISVRGTVDPNDYRDAIRFSTTKQITIDHLDNNNEVLFSLIVPIKKLIMHEYELDYADSGLCHHLLEWAIDDVEVMTLSE